jgi:hypothetical protein
MIRGRPMTTIALRTPLVYNQIQAASRIHARLESWIHIDAALDALRVTLPNFDISSCLVKAAAVNQLYGTNVMYLPTVAVHVSEVLARNKETDLVEELATVEIGGKTVRYVSFASKFAHFFVDKDRYPIVDSYARIRLNYHLSGVRLADPPAYAEYVAAHAALIELADLRCSGRELDRYLWLSGLHQVWSRGEQRINVEVRGLFERSDGDVALSRDLLELSKGL